MYIVQWPIEALIHYIEETMISEKPSW